MVGSVPEGGETGYFRTYRGATALGLAYLLVGIGLFTAFGIDSTEFFVGVILATLAVVAISLYIIVRAEGIRTRPNAIIGVFVVLSLGLLFGLEDFTDLSAPVVFAIVIVVGVLVPNLLLNHTRLGEL
jgi:choline-glycine betaine transporter